MKKSKNGKKNGYSAKKNAIAIKKLKHLPEIKYKANIRPYLASVLNADVHLLNGLVKGSDWGDRIGQDVISKFLEINFYAYNQHLTQSNRIRLMVINDKFPQGIALNTGRLFFDNTNNLSRILCLEDKALANDFKIYYDKVFTFSSHDTSSDAQDERHIKIRIPLRNKIQYNSLNTGLVNDIELNAFYLIVVADNITTNWYYNSQWSYTDV